MNASALRMIPQVSPKIHPGRVKLGKREKGLNIKRNNNSLFMLSCPPGGGRTTERKRRRYEDDDIDGDEGDL